jgi:uncharacterized protein YhfF
MPEQPSPEVEAFWAAYVNATGATGPHAAWGFGDDDKPELMTRLGLLVRDGPKRATTSRLDDYDAEADPIPAPGDHSVILDGDGRPICIIRTTAVEIRPYGDVDDAFAWDEGEGDRSLADWRRGHEWYFASVGSFLSASRRSGRRPPTLTARTLGRGRRVAWRRRGGGWRG